MDYAAMTNEELCMLARGGNQDALAQLWGNVRWLCFKIAKNYLTLYERRGMDRDDLEHDLFLAMVEAVAYYKPEKETKFTSYLTFPIKTRCLRDALKIINGKTCEVKTICIDAPIAKDAEATYGELLPDPEAARQLEQSEEQIYIQQLHRDLDAALDKVTPNEATAVREHYWKDKSITEISEQLDLSYSRTQQILTKALRKMRRNAELWQYRDDVLEVKAYTPISVNSWRRGGSVVERTVEYLERWDTKHTVK